MSVFTEIVFLRGHPPQSWVERADHKVDENIIARPKRSSEFLPFPSVSYGSKGTTATGVNDEAV